VDVVEEADRYLKSKIESKELALPAATHYDFAGTYQNQINFQKRFAVILPASLLAIFLILYFQFRSTPLTLLIFVQIAVVCSGGFIGIWLSAQPWFLNFDVFGHNLRSVFHLREYNLSVAVWVGFIALFGLATDDAVVISTYLNQMFASRAVAGVPDIRRLVVEGGRKRVRPCLMTTATTVLALLPVLTSSGKGADVMIPMALPLVGGVTIELITLFITPVVYCWLKELLWKTGRVRGHFVAAQA
jgi:Cu(I)/Ag(I) efflux system membrane protein CusA/SilA